MIRGMILGGAALFLNAPMYGENLVSGTLLTSSAASFHYAAGKDLRLLTDGVAATALDEKTVVGWEFAGQIVLTADLGQIRSIDEVALHSINNPSSGALAPEKIIAFVSEDGKTYRNAGELSVEDAVGKKVADGTYRPSIYKLSGVASLARYLKVAIIPRGMSFFASELVVSSGQDQPNGKSTVHPEVADLDKYILKSSTELHAERRVSDDYKETKADLLLAVSRSELDADDKKQIYKKIKMVGELVAKDKVLVDDPLLFRAVAPMSGAHAEVFALHGLVSEKLGGSQLEVSTPNRWDLFRPTVEGAKAKVTRDLSISAFRGERRSDALVVGNAFSTTRKFAISIEGDSATSARSDLQLLQTEWTDTKKGKLVASALTPLVRDGDTWTLEIPAGMTRMVWLQFSPQASDEGSVWNGSLKVASSDMAKEVPIRLRVFEGEWPKLMTLHSGGWDYLSEALGPKLPVGLTGASPSSPESLKVFLEAHFTDTPWAVGILGYGKYDAEGKMIEAPSVENFDKWVRFWPSARRYAIFSNSLTEIDGKKMGTPAFDRAVQAWAKFWSDHIRALELKQEILLLLVDEPGMHEGQTERMVAWASGVKASGGLFKVWSNSVFKNPQEEADAALWATADVICPLRTQMLERGPEFTEFFRAKGREGKTLELYSCDGPAFDLDPYTYFRLQGWSAVSLGAVASSFWQFSNLSELGLSWNEYINNYISYAPFFLGKDGVNSARQMEAIREGIQDYEYFQMLTKLVAQAKALNLMGAEIVQAESLLKSSAETVLNAAGASETKWDVAKDRSSADAIVEDIGESIGKLTKGLK